MPPDTDGFVERRALVGSASVPWFIFFAPDGSRLVSAGTGEIRTWDLSAVGPDVCFPVDLEQVTRIARSVLTRGFTQHECERYFAGEECPTFDV